MTMVRRVLYLVLAATILLGSANLYAAAECSGAAQCNFYSDVKPNFDGASGSWYCGWYGNGCTECVNPDCGACYVYGNAQCVS